MEQNPGLARCWNPDRPDEDFELVISCLCTGDHQPLEFEIDRRGNPVGPVTGNMLCWYGLLRWVTKGCHPDSRLVYNQWTAWHPNGGGAPGRPLIGTSGTGLGPNLTGPGR